MQLCHSALLSNCGKPRWKLRKVSMQKNCATACLYHPSFKTLSGLCWLKGGLKVVAQGVTGVQNSGQEMRSGYYKTVCGPFDPSPSQACNTALRFASNH